MLHEATTKLILKACFAVINELGGGFLESVYEKALLVALHQEGLKAEAQVPLNVFFRGHTVGAFFADILVENAIIIELKTVQSLAPQHQAQAINYLKATGLEVALLVNFAKPHLEYKRLYNQPNNHPPHPVHPC